MKNLKYARVVYGIREGINFPCFIRLVYSIGNDYKVQILENKEVSLLDVTIERSNSLFIPLNQEIYLNISRPNYGIALSKDVFICGSKKEIDEQMHKRINNFDIYFRIEYYDFICDYINLAQNYALLSTSTEVSTNTREWANTEFHKIQNIIDYTYHIVIDKSEYMKIVSCYKMKTSSKKDLKNYQRLSYKRNSCTTHTPNMQWRLVSRANLISKKIDKIPEIEKDNLKNLIMKHLSKNKRALITKQNDYVKIVNNLLKLKK